MIKNTMLALATITLLASASTASFAVSPYDVTDSVNSLDAIQEAYSATVQTVNVNEANTLSFANDVASVQALVKANPKLVNTIERQGFTVDQIVGVSGKQTGLTLYAL
ncbi:MAG: hypothetical protein ACOH2L_13215 [Devosia sp.]